MAEVRNELDAANHTIADLRYRRQLAYAVSYGSICPEPSRTGGSYCVHGLAIALCHMQERVRGVAQPRLCHGAHCRERGMAP